MRCESGLNSELKAHETLVAALLDRFRKNDPHTRLIQTHISSVILTGDRAWKLKKPVNFGFLDYTDRLKRIHYCYEELRCNRPLAAKLYLQVVEIRGTPENPLLDETQEGEVIDAAVVMRRFPDGARLDEVVAHRGLTVAEAEALAEKIAHFHLSAPRAAAASPLGEPETIYAPIAENFTQIRPLLDPDDRARSAQLEALWSWSETRHQRLLPLMATRKKEGFIREVHGDMHLGNMAYLDGEIVIFDAIEFNEAFRTIDVVSEIAFLLMDLDDHGLTRQERRLRNRYFEMTGDYAGVALLPFYQVYRALVRAKVALLSARTLDKRGAAEALDHAYRYLDLAERYTQPSTPRLFITFGPSGSGKSYASRLLAERIDAICLRSDVERRRLFPPERSDEARRYHPQATAQIYAHLLKLAKALLAADFSVIIDATFLAYAQRQAARELAAALGVPFHILAFACPEPLLRERVTSRSRQGDDPSEATVAVLAQQLHNIEPLRDEEQPLVLPIDSSGSVEAQLDRLAARF